MFTGLQISSLSTLWSMEFISLICHAYAQSKGGRRRKWSLVLLLVVCILLGATVGPSTANLMQPRLDDWPAGGTDFYLSTLESDLYPLEIANKPELESCRSWTGDEACLYAGYDRIARDFMAFWPNLTGMDNLPEEIMMPSRHAFMQMSFRTRAEGILWNRQWTSTTVSPAGVSDALTQTAQLWAYAAANAEKKKRFRYRKDATFAVDTRQPVVMARCFDFNSTVEAVDNEVYFPNLDINNDSVEGLVLTVQSIAFACITGWSSNCWDTASEIAVLAFNTEASDTFRNTGAGIRTMGTYSKPIQVVAKDGKLVIATLERSLSQSHEKIKPGQAYG